MSFPLENCELITTGASKRAAFIAAHRDLLAGRRKAIGWGASNGAPYFISQAPYKFDFLIDRKAANHPGMTHSGLEVLSAEILTQCNPNDYVIVLFADEATYGDQIRAEARRYGDFDVVRPLQPPEDCFDVYEPPRKGRALQLQNDRAFRSLARRLRPQMPAATRCNAVVLFIGSLSTGGAEKQIVLLAQGLRKLGHEVHLLTVYPSSEGTAPWEKALEEAGVIRTSAHDSRPGWWQEFQTPGTPSHRIFQRYSRFTDLGNLHQLAFLYEYLLAVRPHVLITYLDAPNLTGAIAGIEAEIPHVIMSGRNIHPGNFPDLAGFFFKKSRLRYAYRCLLSLPGMYLTNNSRAGARSYTDWLGIPLSRIPVIPNAIEPVAACPAHIREMMDIPQTSSLILGVMRLSEEKDPFLFLEILERVNRSMNATGVLVGDGPLAGQVRQRIKELKLDDKIKLLGRRSDIFSLMAEADLLLHTSREEGMPNVLLEAQICGCPIVATNVGGTKEAVHVSCHDYLYSYRNVDQASDLVEQVLKNPEGALRQAQIAKNFLLGTRTAEHLAHMTLSAIHAIELT